MQKLSNEINQEGTSAGLAKNLPGGWVPVLACDGDYDFFERIPQYRAQEQDLRETLGSSLLSIARTGALLVDPQLHAEVETTLT